MPGIAIAAERFREQQRKTLERVYVEDLMKLFPDKEENLTLMWRLNGEKDWKDTLRHIYAPVRLVDVHGKNPKIISAYTPVRLSLERVRELDETSTKVAKRISSQIKELWGYVKENRFMPSASSINAYSIFDLNTEPSYLRESYPNGERKDLWTYNLSFYQIEN